MSARMPLPHRSLLLQFLVPTALILILCVGAIGVVTHLRTQQAFGNYVTAQRAQGLTARARVLAVTIRLLYSPDGDWTAVQQFLVDQTASARGRLLVEATDGTILADSVPTSVGQHFVHSSNSIVVPIRRRGGQQTVGRLALIPVAGGSQAQRDFLSSVDSGFLLIGTGALAAALALAFFSVRRITVPLSAMTAAAARLAGGDLTIRVAASDTGDQVAVLGAAFNQMAASLEETQRLRRAQTADIAHELRTPLTSVRGYLEAIQDGAVDATPAVLGSMHEEVLLLGRLVEDMQDLALAEAGQLTLHPVRQPLPPLVMQAVEMQALAARERGVDLRVLPPTGHQRSIAVDAPRLSQVLRNLIANALINTPPGGSVTLSVRGEERSTVIQVRDTGRGIAPEHLPYIFERFYRADASRDRATGGAGIGLSVARGIVQAHGGTIAVHSVVGKGTEFSITLPS